MVASCGGAIRLSNVVFGQKGAYNIQTHTRNEICPCAKYSDSPEDAQTLVLLLFMHQLLLFTYDNQMMKFAAFQVI